MDLKMRMIRAESERGTERRRERERERAIHTIINTCNTTINSYGPKSNQEDIIVSKTAIVQSNIFD